MKKIYSFIIIILFALISQATSKNIHHTIFANDSSKAMIVIEAQSNRILMAKNETVQRANASTTKIATFLTVLKHCKNFDQKVKIDDRAIGIEGTSIYLKKGEQLTVEELLYGMMLVSGNDAATALALHISSSVEEFATLMTNEAKKCGAKNTTFKNPHGLDQNGHLTTAYDLAQIVRECYKYPLFEKIVTTKNTKITDSTGNGYRYLKNKNKLLWTFDGANGVKTGFTNNAGRCLVSSAKRDNMHLICVVLSCGPMFEESAIHLEECFNKYKMCTILNQNSYLTKIPVKNTDNELIDVYTKQGFSFPLTTEEKSNIKTIVNFYNNIIAPLNKDQIVGELEIYLNKHLIFSEKIYTMEEIKSNRIEDNIKNIISKW